MMGKHSGVNARIRAVNPHIVILHCVCHRLSLAVKQASDSVPAANASIDLVRSIQNYVNNSSSVLKNLKDVAARLHAKIVKVKKVSHISYINLSS